jgi:hypothetical protein
MNKLTKLKINLLVAFICFSSFAMAMPKDGLPPTVTRTSLYKKMIHTNPLSLTVGGFEMGFEKVTQQKESFYIQAGYYLSQAAGSLDVKDDGYSNMNGVRLELQYRFYRKSNNYIKNIFIAPFVNFKTISADFETTQYSSSGTRTTIKEKRAATTVSFGYMMGIRKSVFENVYMDFSIGGGVFIPAAGDSHEKVNIPFVNPYQRGVQFKANLGFCLAL